MSVLQCLALGEDPNSKPPRQPQGRPRCPRGPPHPPGNLAVTGTGLLIVVVSPHARSDPCRLMEVATRWPSPLLCPVSCSSVSAFLHGVTGSGVAKGLFGIDDSTHLTDLRGKSIASDALCQKRSLPPGADGAVGIDHREREGNRERANERAALPSLAGSAGR
jgi:hypothetical protein